MESYVGVYYSFYVVFRLLHACVRGSESLQVILGSAGGGQLGDADLDQPTSLDKLSRERTRPYQVLGSRREQGWIKRRPFGYRVHSGPATVLYLQNPLCP